MATQAQRRAQTRGTLLAVARSSFGRLGFERVNIDELAEAAGVTRGAIYHHFTGKQQLFEHVFEIVEQELLSHVLNTTNTQPKHPLFAGALAYIEMASRPEVAQIVLIDGPAVLGPARYRTIDQKYFLPLVSEAIHADAPPKFDPLANAIYAGLCELALQAHLHPKSKRAIEQALQQLIESVAPSKPSPSRRNHP
jgi:AcrR family transcriptional regulator